MLHLLDNIYLKSYTYGYILTKDTGRTDKEGKNVYVDFLFPATLEGVVDYLIKYQQRKKAGEVESLQELLIECKKINKETKEILEEIRKIEKCK